MKYLVLLAGTLKCNAPTLSISPCTNHLLSDGAIFTRKSLDASEYKLNIAEFPELINILNFVLDQGNATMFDKNPVESIQLHRPAIIDFNNTKVGIIAKYTFPQGPEPNRRKILIGFKETSFELFRAEWLLALPEWLKTVITTPDNGITIAEMPIDDRINHINKTIRITSDTTPQLNQYISKISKDCFNEYTASCKEPSDLMVSIQEGSVKSNMIFNGI